MLCSHLNPVQLSSCTHFGDPHHTQIALQQCLQFATPSSSVPPCLADTPPCALGQHVLAAWHPLLSDRSGQCVAVTIEGPWTATPRAETISVVEVVSARDSAGGMLNALLPLVRQRNSISMACPLPRTELLTVLAASTLSSYLHHHSALILSSCRSRTGHMNL